MEKEEPPETQKTRDVISGLTIQLKSLQKKTKRKRPTKTSLKKNGIKASLESKRR